MAAKVGKSTLRKSKQIQSKTSLNSPYEKAWTPVVGEDMHFILKTLTEKFTQVGLKKIEIKKKFPKKSKKEISDGTDKKPDLGGGSEEETPVKAGWTLNDIRKHLAIGINEVTRALEKDQLNLVIVCKSAKPQMITQHLIELSASRRATACQLPRLSENLAPVLGLKSVLALGFRKTSDIFEEAVRAIAPRVPPLKVLWLTGKPRRDKKKTMEDEEMGDTNTTGATSRKRKHPPADEAEGVQLQSLKVKKIVPNPNKKRKRKVKKTANKK